MPRHEQHHCLVVLSGAPPYACLVDLKAPTSIRKSSTPHPAASAVLVSLDHMMVTSGCQHSCWAGIVILFDPQRWSEQRRLSVTGNILARWFKIPIALVEFDQCSDDQALITFWRKHATAAPKAIQYSGEPHITKPSPKA